MTLIERRKYNMDRYYRLRKEFFTGKCCVVCGSKKKLEIDPKKKIDHKIWSWSEKRRKQELEKCQVMCNTCHKKKTKLDLTKMFLGVPKFKLRKISDEQILIAKDLRTKGKTCREIGKMFGVAYNTISELTTKNLQITRN